MAIFYAPCLRNKIDNIDGPFRSTITNIMNGSVAAMISKKKKKKRTNVTQTNGASLNSVGHAKLVLVLFIDDVFLV